MDMQLRKLTPIEENQLRLDTTAMYEYGGISNVLASVHMMTQCQLVVLEKLGELLEEERGSRKP